MRIRYRAAALAATAAAVMTLGLMGAGAAAAATRAGNHICETNFTSLCLYSEGYQAQVHVQSTGSLTNFVAENFDGDYAEYKQNGTSNCLQVHDGYVWLNTCASGKSSELWVVNGGGQLVSDYNGDCMEAPNTWLIFGTCSDHNSTSYWIGTA